ncbi:cob(I)yrinic acid a,c-diamide adenosyltransferase [Sporomusa acidovorans]|uniref:Corrinoid adenosyltransferase n=1 Tax=Sporomusa acidovorans (strain ATCC 49682 / DSM 3132 / Mol) TaxID=1123286 RepID=A0ABZ3IZQ3_SPOA4|nr:cob(I)yrinic acid a,c-diamide adenosyltransferase [Sporomusa acidovorans]OZC14137.1 Cob(I)yrinic acid a,c-diamide adenosyltransferase [Sporomusa acidovorans DSM 3132]SDE69287.1 Haem-degrading [Sporomusa acidovorans]
MKVYTKTGDEGKTSLLSKERIFKDSVRVHAYGTVDEANAAMGLAKSLTNRQWAIDIIHPIQQELILLNADLATAEVTENSTYRITHTHVERLEKIIDQLEERRIPQHYFVTPGGTQASAALDLARTIVRRAERYIVRLKRTETVNTPVALYVNRLSDLLFVLARCVEQEELITQVTQIVMQVLQEAKQADGGKSDMLEKAKKLIAAAEKKALEINVPMVIAVVDAGGNLVAHERMDDALLASVSIALNKAYTAVALKMSTEQAAAVAQPGQSLYGINTTDGCRLVIFGGGIPIWENGVLIGGIGVSGGSVDEDMSVAKAGLEALQ